MVPQDDTGKIAEPPLRALYAYWSGKRGDGSWPLGSGILLEEIPSLAPYVMLVDVLENGRFFRFRVVGADVAFGIDPTGKLQHEALPDGIYRDHITALFRRGAAGPGALYSLSSYDYTTVEGPRSISRLFMPLAGNGGTIDMMMIGQIHDRSTRIDFSAWQANPPTITEEIEFRLL